MLEAKISEFVNIFIEQYPGTSAMANTIDCCSSHQVAVHNEPAGNQEHGTAIDRDIISLPKTTNELQEMANDFNTPTLLGDTGKYKYKVKYIMWNQTQLCPERYRDGFQKSDSISHSVEPKTSSVEI